MADPNSLAPPGYGYNPHTNHFVLKTGAVWKRLVKSGAVTDPELVAAMAAAAASRRKPIAPKPPAPKPPAPAPVASKATSRALARKKPAIVLARKVVAENKSELDDLESDAATDFITQKLAIRTKRECLESASEDASEEEKARKKNHLLVRQAAGPTALRS